jgi:hypothetical protein
MASSGSIKNKVTCPSDHLYVKLSNDVLILNYLLNGTKIRKSIIFSHLYYKRMDMSHFFSPNLVRMKKITFRQSRVEMRNGTMIYTSNNSELMLKLEFYSRKHVEA